MTYSHMTDSHVEGEVIMPKNTFLNLSKEKQDKIINAAIEELKIRNYKEITIDNIVLKSSISKGSFYQYFINKDDLYKYIFSIYGEMKKEVLELLEIEPTEIELKSYLCKVVIHGQNFEEELDDNHMLKHKFFNECSQELKKELMADVIPKGIELVKNILEKYRKYGKIREKVNIDIAAYLIVMSVVSLDEYPYLRNNNIEKTIEEMFDVIVNGIV